LCLTLVFTVFERVLNTLSKKISDTVAEFILGNRGFIIMLFQQF